MGKSFSDDSHDDFKPKKAAVDLSNEDEVQKLIANHVAEHSILLYMKGTPSAPQCGYISCELGLSPHCSSC
jgi:hypothetical protein